MWSGLLEPGMTTTPRCKFHRKVTWAEVTPWALKRWMRLQAEKCA